MNNVILNFSLGPVQGFIAQARKTRDFWTGSFLLSYLAGEAMAVILDSKGHLILPSVAKNKEDISDPILQAVMDRRTGKKVVNGNRSQPAIATLPNRFRAEVPADFEPALCQQAVMDNWYKIASLIWEHYLNEPSTLGKETREIWDRQVSHFWEINWVIDEDPSALDLRKNWRCHVPAIEPGDKCTLFGELQELSGYLRIYDRKKQDEFWRALREQAQTSAFYALDKNERLCSIALIKRFFPYIARDIIFEGPIHYPSTPYLAAINWIASVTDNKSEVAKDFAQMASSLPGARGNENPDLFPSLKKQLDARPWAREFATLDGNCFYKAALENHDLWDRRFLPAAKTEKKRSELVKRLEDFGKPPSPFYAMLLMDGDLLGALLRKYADKTGKISNALKLFALGVPSVVEENNGVTVFAGGDDVLALIPLENALPAALSLHDNYLSGFEKEDIKEATISGAIVYAHYNTPLTEVYHEAQSLLSDVAKEQTGRDSLAVTVWKGAGKVLTWSAPWKIVACNFNVFLEEFLKDLPEAKFKDFSNSFFYNIQNRLALFAEKGTDLSAFSDVLLRDLLIAEYVKSRGPDTDRIKAGSLMEQLLELCRPYWRNQNGKVCKTKHRLQLDSLFLIKFLAEKGVEN